MLCFKKCVRTVINDVENNNLLTNDDPTSCKIFTTDKLIFLFYVVYAIFTFVIDPYFIVYRINYIFMTDLITMEIWFVMICIYQLVLILTVIPYYNKHENWSNITYNCYNHMYINCLIFFLLTSISGVTFIVLKYSDRLYDLFIQYCIFKCSFNMLFLALSFTFVFYKCSNNS